MGLSVRFAVSDAPAAPSDAKIVDGLE